MTTQNADQELWAMASAAGEGKRVQEFLAEQCGLYRPKQFSPTAGTLSMLSHTLDRANLLVHPKKLLPIMSDGHVAYALEDRISRSGRQ